MPYIEMTVCGMGPFIIPSRYTLKEYFPPPANILRALYDAALNVENPAEVLDAHKRLQDLIWSIPGEFLHGDVKEHRWYPPGEPLASPLREIRMKDATVLQIDKPYYL